MNPSNILANFSARVHTGRPAWLWLALLGGLVFSAVFQWRYQSLDPDFYQFRDDGIITLSHARNWIDFGFIGVNPSGERIEATSAPLQFLLYAAAYGLTGVGYEGFISAQTVACTFALGVLVALLFAARPLFALAAAALSALALTEFPAFMIWHGSGMENALTHVFLLWTVLLLHRFASTGRVVRAWVLVPFAASISRIDGLYYVLPLLVVFCLFWHWKRNDRQARGFTMLFLGLWLAFNAARYVYFGSLMPNTAVAQGISIGDRLLELFALSPTYLDQSFGLARSNFSRHGAYLLLLALPFLAFRTPSEPVALLLALLACVILSAFFAPFVFGPARLDPARTTTQLALCVPLVVAAAVVEWRPRRADAYAIPIVAALVFLVHEYNHTVPTKACCSPRDFDATRLAFERIGRDNGIARPTVANPDLGVLSWHKHLNVVDLGMLGSSLLSRLEQGPVLNRYLFDHVAPDIVESHGWWTCRYASFFGDPRFRAAYVEAVVPGQQVMSCAGRAVPTGIWVRRDVLRGSDSAERSLMDDLARAPSAARVAAELRACAPAAAARPAACSYVARSVYRLLPEFRARGEQQQLEALFARGRSPGVDLHLVRGFSDARAWRAALAELKAQAGEP